MVLKFKIRFGEQEVEGLLPLKFWVKVNFSLPKYTMTLIQV